MAKKVKINFWKIWSVWRRVKKARRPGTPAGKRFDKTEIIEILKAVAEIFGVIVSYTNNEWKTDIIIYWGPNFKR